MFQIGQRVVCVNVDDLGTAGDRDGLTKGTVYTVRAHAGPSWADGTPSIHLQEIYRPSARASVGYRIARFRPVDETRLSVFRQMLVNPPKEHVHG